MSNGLILFIRNPERGKVKTRLAQEIGDAAALHIYQRLLAHTRGISIAVPVRRFLFYADSITQDDAWENSLFEKHLQEGPNLGARMAGAFAKVFNHGCHCAVIIGSDCPGLSPDLLKTAFRQLLLYDIVIGPARDGGYYLLGMKDLHHGLFSNKSWSTDAVLQETLRDIAQAGLSCYQLPMLADVDFAEDLKFMQHLL